MKRKRQTEYLVTGGAGFIGSNIVRRLVSDGRSVRVLDDLSTGRLDNIRDLLDDVEFIRGDIRDPKTVQKAVKGVRNVLHLGALPSVPRSVQDPITSNQVNACGTLRMLMASRDAGVARFVFSSSSSVYGETPVLPKRESMTPSPLSPYAVQKLTGEHYCRVFHGLYGLETFCLRYFNVFGPRQNPASQYAAVIPLFIKAVCENKPPTIYGDGKQSRDFTFVDDVVRANIACCRASRKAAGGVYNVARGDRVSLLELLRLLEKITGRKVKPRHEAPRPGDVRHSQADSALAKKFLGWTAQVTFEEGLRRTVAYFSNQGG